MRLLTAFAILCLLSTPALAAEGAEFPFRADSGLTKAEAQLGEGKYMQALDTLGNVLKRHPADADALTYTGYAWYKLGEAKKAALHFDRALKYNPKHQGANKYKADILLDNGDFQMAMEQMQVLRMICGSMHCAELDALQSKMNAHQAGKKGG